MERRDRDGGRLIELRGTSREVEIVLRGLELYHGLLLQKKIINSGPKDRFYNHETVEKLLSEINHTHDVETALLPDGLWPE